VSLKLVVRTLYALAAALPVLFYSGCRDGGDIRKTVIKSIKADEATKGWHVIVDSVRGISYLDVGNSQLHPLYPESDDGAGSAFIGMASASPSGDKIVFSESKDSKSYSLVIYDLKRKTRESHFQLPYLRGPRWSKDGAYIAFEGTTTETPGSSDLYLYKVGSDDFSVLVKEDLRGGEATLCWAPDSKSIVYESGGENVSIVDIQNKRIRIVDSGQFPTWSPNGQYLGYQNKDKGFTLYDISNGRKIHLLENSSLRMRVVWSPDSRYVIYSKASGGILNWITDAFSLSDSYGDLWALDVQSGIEVRLYRHSGSVYATDWGKLETEITLKR
jgi:Tol biopolymer transport system component